MKLTAEMKKHIREFVELNGLYPQHCGSPLKDLLKAVGIDWHTFKRWEENTDFADLLSRARATFAQQSEIEIVNALKRAALGIEFTEETSEATAQVIREYDPKTGKKVKEYTTDKLVPKKAKRKTVVIPPSVEAGKFMLKNLAPERWKDKQEIGGGLSLTDEEQRPEIVIE